MCKKLGFADQNDNIYRRRACGHAGPSTCNALPNYLKPSIHSLSTFRRRLKHFYFSLCKHIERVRGFFRTVTVFCKFTYILTYLLRILTQIVARRLCRGSQNELVCNYIRNASQTPPAIMRTVPQQCTVLYAVRCTLV